MDTVYLHPGLAVSRKSALRDDGLARRLVIVDPATSSDIALLRDLVERYAPNGRNIVVTPFWPGAYAVLERKSPMWENYALFSRSKSFQNKEIERINLAAPGLVLVINSALDGRDELRFRNTHSLTYSYIRDNFDLTTDPAKPEYEIYKARSGTQ